MTDIRLITFTIGNDLYVMDIMSVRQIIPYQGSNPVPKAPAFIEGIVVLRHEVVPVIDLRGRMYPELGPVEEGMPLLLITRFEDSVIGLKVDEVRRIITVDLESILPAPPLIRNLDGNLFVGVVSHGDQVYLLLDLASFLTEGERVSLTKTNFDAVSAAEVGKS